MRHQRGGTILGLFIGLVLGVLVAFGVVWYLNKSPFPFMDKGAHTDRPEARRASRESAESARVPLARIVH